ncbi:Uma2 family endonuclease [Anabaena lutea]|uniref:Uma2 family endonuclease n=1 Tax=Anabaena lutea TaxID=212350 RepID=UPI001F550D15|nr:Uma2 family endonuclease [Anabaena lutea]
MQWKEAGIPPQIVFEILSPINTKTEMEKKLLFYDRYGVEEYYIYDPEKNNLQGWLRGEDGLDIISQMVDFVSPRLKIREEVEATIQRLNADGRRYSLLPAGYADNFVLH